MTTEELAHKLSIDYGLNNWPPFYEVDAETYANVCHYTFNHLANFHPSLKVTVSIGPHHGIMFKNVELILEAKNDRNN